MPDGCIFQILQYYSKAMTVRCMVQFGCMTSSLYRAVLSNSLRLIWPSLPPICLCDAKHCVNVCGREKIPLASYKSLISKCGSYDNKVDIHFSSSYCAPSTFAASVANQARMLVNECVDSVEDLVLHVTIMSPPKGRDIDEALPFACELSVPANQMAVDESHCPCEGPGHSALYSAQEKRYKSFPKLTKLLINLEYNFQNDEILLQQSMTGAICVEILGLFGLNLQSLSVFTYHLKNRPDSKSEYGKLHCNYDRSMSRENCLAVVCPFLSKLELYGCNLNMFNYNRSSQAAASGLQLRSSDSNENISDDSALYSALIQESSAFEFSPLSIPALRVLEVEENFKASNEIFSVFRLLPLTTTHIVLMGNTSKFLKEILDFISTMKLCNTSNMEILEIHDFSPWPFCDEINHFDASTVESVFKACPNLKKIVMSTVSFTDSALRSLAENMLEVANLSHIYSTVVTRKCDVNKKIVQSKSLYS